ncbi:MAG TPA: hypothetical protein DCM32_05625 [Xanthomonadaceae bacterium]|nr:hypothetical protein [Xanthomonadaceae bacterium]
MANAGDTVDAATRAAPAIPIAITGLSYYGIGMQDWVYIATIVLTVGLIVQNAVKFYWAWQDRKAKRSRHDDQPKDE